jgi:hypothetical protein
MRRRSLYLQPQLLQPFLNWILLLSIGWFSKSRSYRRRWKTLLLNSEVLSLCFQP